MRKSAPAKALSFVSVLISLVIFTGCSYIDDLKKGEADTSQVYEQGEQVTLTIVDDEGKTFSYDLDYMENESAYQLLQRAMESNESLDIEFDEFAFDGETSYFIKSINGYNPTDDNSFWLFNVNNEMSSVGISSYIMNEGDRISFELDEIQ